MSTLNIQLIFRQLNNPVPEGWVAGVRWVVEAYPAGVCDLPYPMGQAWVSDYTPFNQSLISLDFILVADQHRREGVAIHLYNEIKKRWPNVIVTDAISKSGDGFLDNVEPWRVKAKAGHNKAKNDERKKNRKRKKLERQRRL